MEILDISIPLRPDFPVWPGDSQPIMRCPLTHEAGDGVQLTHLSLSAHTGTHLDAPRHFVANAGLVSGLDLSTLIGPASVVHFRGDGPIPVGFFESLDLPEPVTRLLLRCDINSGKLNDRNTFFEDYAAVTPEAAQWLVDRGIRLIGTDYLSIGPFHSGNAEVHRILLGANIIIVEGLDLRDAAPGQYMLVCLPIAVPCDGAPCRAVLLPSGSLDKD
jgi:arylformamidase